MSFPKRAIPLTWLTGLFLLNFILRLPDIGHFLTWDEAWLLSSLKDFFGKKQLYSIQLWKHPPIYMGLGMLLSPVKPGFDIRMQIFSLIISSGALVFFTILFAKLFGRRIALLTGLIYTMLPATLFFDTWIKRDGLVTLFCALTLLALIEKKDVLAGIFCGLCFLSKETAIFFTFGFLAFILIHRPPDVLKRSLLLFCGTVIAASSWWYLFFYSFTDMYLAFFQGLSEESSGFIEPWWYYLAKLKIDLGWTGLLLFIAGIIAVIPGNLFRRGWKLSLSQFKKSRFLPLFMLVPGYMVLSLSHGKTPWMTISFSPFLALLMALGWLFLFKLTSQAFSRFKNKGFFNNSWVSITLLTGLLVANSFPFNYLSQFKKMSPGLATMVIASYEMSDVVNKNVRKNEKLLILPMIFRTGSTQSDPILNWNLKSIKTLYSRDTNWDFAKFQQTIIQNKISWVLIFPVSGSWQEDLFTQTIQKMNPTGYMFSTGYLLKVDSYLDNNQE